MNNEIFEELEQVEQAARKLIGRIKHLTNPEIDLPVSDDTCMWIVKIRRVRILEED